MTKRELITFIEGEISYDASIDYHCERCGHEPHSYWLDHKDSLAASIALRIGLKTITPILDLLNDFQTDGDITIDAQKIAAEIDDKIIGLPSLSTKVDIIKR